MAPSICVSIYLPYTVNFPIMPGYLLRGANLISLGIRRVYWFSRYQWALAEKRVSSSSSGSCHIKAFPRFRCFFT